MTMPDERYRAVFHTQMFLLELCNPEKTPRVPKHIRNTASRLLRHYPGKSDLDAAARACPDVFIENIEDVRRMFMVYEQGKDNEA